MLYKVTHYTCALQEFTSIIHDENVCLLQYIIIIEQTPNLVASIYMLAET